MDPLSGWDVSKKRFCRLTNFAVKFLVDVVFSTIDDKLMFIFAFNNSNVCCQMENLSPSIEWCK